jgi:membrane protein DedA with SNARE-associated domain
MNVSVAGLLAWAGQSPVLEGLAIILGTFILEDAATVLAAMQAQDGKIALGVAITSLYLGIVLGDLGLYGLGRLASRIAWFRRFIPDQKRTRGQRWLRDRVFRVVFVSRFIPGARLPTYTACGFLHADFRRFALAAIGATLIWTSALFVISMRVGKLIIEHLGAWRWAGAIGFAAVVVLTGRIIASMQEQAE